MQLIGNLNYFIGTVLGNTNYIRNRALEFSLKNIPISSLIVQLEETILMIEKVIPSIPSEDLLKTYPIEVFKKPMTTEFFLIHLTTHLSYHIGQINYHRRLLDD